MILGRASITIRSMRVSRVSGGDPEEAAMKNIEKKCFPR